MTKAFSKKEFVFISIICLAIGLRQLAMNMVMPLIPIYSKELSGYTPTLAGVALGAFGLSQAIFQIPYGVLSDKIRRKK